MEIKRKWDKETCGMVEESGGKFPPLLINSVKRTKKGEGKRERKGGEGKRRRKMEKWEEKGKGKFPCVPMAKAQRSEN